MTTIEDVLRAWAEARRSSAQNAQPDAKSDPKTSQTRRSEPVQPDRTAQQPDKTKRLTV